MFYSDGTHHIIDNLTIPAVKYKEMIDIRNMNSSVLLFTPIESFLPRLEIRNEIS